MPAFDYSQIYDLYDSYCTFTGDVPFWSDVVSREGAVLELMAGTGRVSLPLVEKGVSLTCVERDFGMASVLAHKIKLRGYVAANVVCGDVLRLPSCRSFRQVLLPFQGLSEILAPAERKVLFAQVSESLEIGGRFVCTAHNPASRAKTLNGEWQTFGLFPHGQDAVVEVSVRGKVDSPTGLAIGEQLVVLRDARETIQRKHVLPLRFSLPSLAEIIEAAAGASLVPTSVYGGYDRSVYSSVNSLAIIIIFEKAA